MKIAPIQVFRLDGFGAMVSLLCHLFIACNESAFGMPREAVLALAIFPFLLMPFSLYHYFRFPQYWQPSMRLVIIANLFFSIISIGVLAYHFAALTTLGLVYFIGEVIVVLSLVALIELPTLRSALS